MVRNLLFILLLVSLFTQVNAQKFKSFTHEPETYLEEMDKFFERSATNYKKGKELLKRLEEPWLSGKISNHKKESIYEISNLLLNKRARNFPHFYNYLNTILIFTENNTDSIQYIEWEKGLKHLATNKKSKLRHIQVYLKSTQYLIMENAIYYSASVKWYANNSNYDILFENDTIKVVFEKLNLTAKLRNDSIQIHETSGTYYPITNIWKGNSAKVYWEKTGLNRDSAYVELGAYSFKMNKAQYSIPNVKLFNKYYFDYPIMGTIVDKVVETSGKKSISYPKFVSNEKHFEIKGIFEDMDYRGGFNMNGAKVGGAGSEHQYATLSLYRDIELVVNGDTVIEKRLFMQTSSLYYSLTQHTIVAQNAKVAMYIDADSIYHPGLMFKYDDTYREVNLIRDDNPENLSRSLYYDTYHMIDMDFELLKWRMGEQNVDFTMLRGTSINIAQFESSNYFSSERYYEVQGLEDTHPYIMLRRFVRKTNREYFHAEDFSKYIRMPMTITRRLLIELTYKGIVDYDFQTQYCRIKPKLYNYLDAIVGKVDYDLIQFESRINAPNSNATLNLQNMDLAIEGIPMVNVSDSQNVIFYPKNKRILLKKNLNFDFGGTVVAGLFEYYGDNFEFKYDSFKIALNQVDSLSIKVKSGVDNWGRRKLENVENVLENITGDLVIDDPENKSGVKDNPDFPIFRSKQKSYVYYDEPKIQKGKYTRDKFYFIVDEYTIDSLNDFSTDGMGYDGTLVSSDIFPDIEQRLVLQQDNSLGFKHQAPNGLPLYKGKGTYYNEIYLSNNGLRGNGYMEYLTSKETSDDFIFYPDSTNAFTSDFYIGKQTTIVQYPEVKAGEVFMHWMPYLDKLYSETTQEPFIMYEGKAKHTGSLVYTPTEIEGKGVMKYNKAKLSSSLFKYRSESFKSDTANLEIASVNVNKLAIKTDSVKAHVDFTAMESKFKSNTATGKVELPENLYQAYVEEFNWKMDKYTLQMLTPNKVQVFEHGKNRIVDRDEAGLSAKGSLFVSVHKGQDSLNWSSPISDLDLKTNTIYAHEVKYISVADATVFPNEGEVTIEPVAKIRTLLKADINANTDTKYHQFHSSTINISSRNKYHGEGKYNYEDEIGREFVINFDIIAVDTVGNTFAKGKINGTQDFSLSPVYKYQGKVELKATRKLLAFDGHLKINHECDEITESWVKFSTEIDPHSIYIPLEKEPKDINDNFLVSGPMMATDSIHAYPAFLSPRKLYSNFPVITAKEFLYYDKKAKQYEIGSKAKINNSDTVGNYLSLHKNFCTLYGDGNINLGANLGQIKIETKGNSTYDISKDKLSVDIISTLDFFLPTECFKIIADTMSTLSGLKPVSLKRKTYLKGMTELMGYAEADKMFKEQNIFGIVKQVPKILSTSFVFAELNLIWNKKNNSWVSNSPLGIANIKGTQINKKVGGFVEIIRKRSGDEFNLYIKISETHWYFFNYKRGLMQAYSSVAEFNEVIANTKGSDRKLKIKRGETSYVFFLSNLKKRNDFLKRMRGEEVESNDEDGEDYEQYEEYD